MSPAAVVSAAAGLAFVGWSAVSLVRAGTDGWLHEPVVEVAGYTSTAIMALLVLGAGAALLLAATSCRRAVVGVVAGLVTAAAVALAVDPAAAEVALAAERDLAVAIALASGMTAAVAVVAPDVVVEHGAHVGGPEPLAGADVDLSVPGESRPVPLGTAVARSVASARDTSVASSEDGLVEVAP